MACGVIVCLTLAVVRLGRRGALAKGRSKYTPCQENSPDQRDRGPERCWPIPDTGRHGAGWGGYPNQAWPENDSNTIFVSSWFVKKTAPLGNTRRGPIELASTPRPVNQYPASALPVSRRRARWFARQPRTPRPVCQENVPSRGAQWKVPVRAMVVKKTAPRHSENDAGPKEEPTVQQRAGAVNSLARPGEHSREKRNNFILKFLKKSSEESRSSAIGTRRKDRHACAGGGNAGRWLYRDS